MNLTKKILIIFICVTMTGCKKDKPTPDNYISYKLNGVYKKQVPDASSFDDGTFLLDAGPFEKGNLDLFLDTSVYVISYDLNHEVGPAVGDYYDENGTHFWSDSGTMVITSYDGEHISGTFAFRAHTLDSARSTIRVTEGQFTAKIDFLSASPDTSNWDFLPVQPIGEDTCRHTSDGSVTDASRNLKSPGKHEQLRNRYLRHHNIIFGRPAATAR